MRVTKNLLIKAVKVSIFFYILNYMLFLIIYFGILLVSLSEVSAKAVPAANSCVNGLCSDEKIVQND